MSNVKLCGYYCHLVFKADAVVLGYTVLEVVLTLAGHAEGAEV